MEETNTTNVVQAEVPAQEETPRVLQVIERLATLEAMLNASKTLYAERDKLALELKDLVGVGVEVSHGDMIMKVVDNFAEKNTVFRPAGVKRFDLEFDSATARAEKMMKEAGKKTKK